MTPGTKYTLLTVLFYVIVTLVDIVLLHFTPSGPCNPGFGFLFLLLMPVMAIVGFLISFIGLARRGKSFIGPVIINGAALIVLGILLLL